MTTIHTQVMKRIERIQLLRKLFFKTLILGAFVIIAHHFISLFLGQEEMFVVRSRGVSRLTYNKTKVYLKPEKNVLRCLPKKETFLNHFQLLK